MGAHVDLPTTPCSADRPKVGPAQVFLFPTSISKTRWLRREGLRIAAGVNGASLFNVRRILENERARAGLAGPAVDADVAEALAFVEDVRDAADRLGRLPSSRRGGRGA